MSLTMGDPNLTVGCLVKNNIKEQCALSVRFISQGHKVIIQVYEKDVRNFSGCHSYGVVLVKLACLFPRYGYWHSVCRICL